MTKPVPAVLLHAFPLDSSMWAPQIEVIAGHRQIFAPNLPGFGGAPLVEGGLESFADQVILECDAEGIERAVFIGLSMGGYVAMRIADRHLDRVAALVLADTRAGADDNAGKEKRSAQAARARSEGCSWLAEAMIPALLGETTRKTRPNLVAEVTSMIQRNKDEGVARALEAMRERPESLELLASLDIPLLAIVGAEDKLTPPIESERIVERSPRFELEVIPEAGHLSNLERPEQFNDALIRFLGDQD